MAKSSSQGWALDREGDAERNQAAKQRKYEEARLKFEEAERVTTDESDRDQCEGKGHLPPLLLNY